MFELLKQVGNLPYDRLFTLLYVVATLAFLFVYLY